MLKPCYRCREATLCTGKGIDKCGLLSIFENAKETKTKKAKGEKRHDKRKSE